MPLDYAGILAAGRTLVPDLAAQSRADEQLSMQREQFGWQRQQAQQQLQAHELELQEKRAFATARDNVLLNGGKPQDILQLMTRFPKMADSLKPVYEAMDERQRTTNQTQLGSIYANAQAGNYERAAEILEQRIAADRAAGQDVAADEAILAGLRDSDPVHRNAAMATVGIALATAAGPDKFAETYGKLNPTERQTNVQREYEWRVGQFGKAVADRWLETQDESLVTVVPGGSVYRKSDFMGRGNGIVATPEQEAESEHLAKELGVEGVTVTDGFSMPVAGGRPTSGFGAPRDGGARSHNGLDIAAPAGSPITPIKPGKVVAVGNQPDGGLFVRVKHTDGTISGYAHMARQDVKVGQAVDATTQLGTVGTTGNATGPVVHLVIRDKNGRAVDPRPLLGAPMRIRTKQEYDRLPSGTAYTAPDGSQRTKA